MISTDFSSSPVDELVKEFADVRVDTRLLRSVTLNKLLGLIDHRHEVKAELFTDFGLSDQLQFEELSNESGFVKNLILKADGDYTVRDLIEILSRQSRDICYGVCEKQETIIAEYESILNEKFKSRSNLSVVVSSDCEDDDDEVMTKLLSKIRRFYFHKTTDKLNNEVWRLKEALDSTALLVYASSENDSELKRKGIQWFKKRLDKFSIKFKEFLHFEDNEIEEFLVDFDYVFILYDQELADSLDASSGRSRKYAELGRCLYEEYIKKREDGEYTRFYTFLIDDYRQDVDYHWLQYTRYFPFKRIDNDEKNRNEIVKVLWEL